MSGNSVHTSATKAEALTIQSSTQGATIIWLRGQNRIPGNLLWYGDFKATPHTEQTSGGKGGGGGTNTSYTYSASIVLGLCHGVVSAINWVIKSKSKTTLEKLGMSFKSGAVGQPVWSGLAGKGVESLGYSGLACVVAQAYDLGDSTSIENHAFEVTHASAYAISGSVPDVDPAVSTRDLLGHPLQGAAMPASTLGDWTEWSNYCVATGLVMSPYLDAQTDASEALKKIAELTNTAIVWSEGKLKMRPYGDAPATGNGRVFTPNTTPVYELDDTCFLVSDGEVPVKRALKSSTECYNTVSIEYRDRSNDYNTAVVTAKDRTDIAANGIRAKDTITAPWITEGAVARLVAELTKQRALNVLGTYKFRLPMNFALLECMDLVTLTEQQLLLADEPVLIKTITEADDLELEIEAEDYPAGMASAPLYPVQAPQGFAADYLVAPGDTSSVVVFEGPGALTGNQLEVWVAARGDGANWGGCTVWVSLDGTTYRAMGRIEGGSRCGQLTSAITPLPSTSLSQVHVGIGAKQQLINVSEADADALNSLCYVGGATPEFLAYTYATLQSAGNYLLWRLVRGAYGTPSSSAHASGDSFAFIDSSIAKSGLIDDAYVGKTIYIKCTSFNLFGVAEQSLADVDEQAYQITGNYYTSAAELAAQAQAAAISAAAADATAKANAAHDAAVAAAAAAAQAKADLAKAQAQAYADGIVTTAEATAIAAAQTKADAAQAAATAAAKTYADTIPIGGNLLPNSEQTTCTWVRTYTPNPGVAFDPEPQLSTAIWGSGNYVLASGTTQSVALRQTSNSSGIGVVDGSNIDGYLMAADIFLGGYSDSAKIPLVAGGRIIGSVYAATHRCDLQLFLQVYKSDGSWEYPAKSYRFSGTPDTDKLANYTRMSVVYDAPANAVFAKLFVRKFDSKGSDSWVWLAAPQLEYAGATQTEPGPYSPGPGATASQVTDIASAASAASAAASAASTANSLLATMRSNGYLDAAEKPALIKKWHELSDNSSAITAQANALGITTERDAYTAALNNLASYLTGLSPSWTDTTTDTPITPATDAAIWAAAYNAWQALMLKIAVVIAVGSVGTTELAASAATDVYTTTATAITVTGQSGSGGPHGWGGFFDLVNTYTFTAAATGIAAIVVDGSATITTPSSGTSTARFASLVGLLAVNSTKIGEKSDYGGGDVGFSSTTKPAFNRSAYFAVTVGASYVVEFYAQKLDPSVGTVIDTSMLKIEVIKR